MADKELSSSLILSDFVPFTNVATVSAGASIELFEPDIRKRELVSVWDALLTDVTDRPPPPPPPPPPPLPTQLGPFDWNPIVFGGGVPVGGWAQLTLFQNGAVNFTGHFHDSGATSYDMTCTFAVRASDGTVYTFVKTGRVHGTFEAGSRDFDWGENPTNTAVGAGWANLCAGWHWQAKAGANVDIGALVGSAVQALGQAAAVIAIIA